MKKISAANLRLLWWLITDYAKHLAGEVKAGEYWKYKAKMDLIKRYKKTQSDLENYVPFQYLNWEGTKTQEEARDLLIQELQMILLTNETAMSLSQQLMTNETAIKFTGFIFDFLFENEVEMRKEIIELYKQEQNSGFVFGCLMNKKCAVCFNPQVDLHHWNSASSEFGSYEFDDGTGKYMSLCRKHHTEAHNTTKEAFASKYNIKGVSLTSEQAIEIKKKYKNHLKAFKEVK